MKYRSICFILAICLCVQFGFAQEQVASSTSQAEMPTVSLIGEDEEIFSVLAQSHQGIFLEICGNDMDFAYDKWMEMLVAIEDYSEVIDYDIKGVKTYLYVFWNADGTIKHLAFYPKPNSRNIPISELKAFFKGFIKDYKMPIVSEIGYSHYASGAFPTFGRSELSVNKD